MKNCFLVQSRTAVFVFSTLVAVSCRNGKVPDTVVEQSEVNNRKSKSSLSLLNGDYDTNVNDDSVFLISQTKKDKFNIIEGGSIGTAWAAVRKRRCLITASHVASNTDDNDSFSIVHGQSIDLRLEQHIRSQPIRSRKAKVFLDDKTYGPFYDVALLWTADFKGANKISTYKPIVIDTQPLFDHYPGWYNTPPLPTNGLKVDYIGYGRNENDPNETIYIAKRRTGGGVAVRYSEGQKLPPDKRTQGGVILMVPDSRGIVTRGGDSGGPILRNGLAVGVISMGSLENSTGAALSDYTSMYSDPKLISNYKYLMRAADELCTKKVNVSVEASMPGVRKVTASITRNHVYKDVLPLNGLIECLPGSNGDCVENVHEGMTVSLVTEFESGYEFKEWLPVTPQANMPAAALCKCIGQGSTCSLTYDDIGYYTETVSWDGAWCQPMAKRIAGPPPSPPPPPSPSSFPTK